MLRGAALSSSAGQSSCAQLRTSAASPVTAECSILLASGRGLRPCQPLLEMSMCQQCLDHDNSELCRVGGAGSRPEAGSHGLLNQQQQSQAHSN